jgi:NAD(P)-dependent dehydrogenase (short-subunit alcohol dehydrogenase family)
MADKVELDIPFEWPSLTKEYHHKPSAAISPTRPELSAAGKNVVVTGGGTGIGKAIAIAFAEAGAKSVSILGRRIDRLKTSSAEITAARSSNDTQVLIEVTDLTVREEVDKAVKSIVDKVGPIDILVSNVGALPELAGVVGYKESEMMRGFSVNVLSAFNAIQAFVLHAAEHATLLSVSSAIAHMAPIPGMFAYAISKAANLKLLDYFAAENPHIHVVNLQPGVVETEITEGSSVKGQDDRKLPLYA